MRQVLNALAGSHGELLQWHLIKHPSRSLALCIAAIADDAGALPLAPRAAVRFVSLIH